MERRVFKNILWIILAVFFVFGIAFAATTESVFYTITAQGSRNEDTQAGYWEEIQGGYWEDQQSGYWERSGTGTICDLQFGGEGEAGSSQCREEHFPDCQSYWDSLGYAYISGAVYLGAPMGCSENQIWRDTSTRVWRETLTRVWHDTSTTEAVSWSASENGSFTIACETNKYITTSSLRAPNGNTSWSVSDNNPLVSTSMSGPNLYATNVSLECGGQGVPSGASQQQQGQPPSSSGPGQGQQGGASPSEPSAPSEPSGPAVPPSVPSEPQTPEFQEI